MVVDSARIRDQHIGDQHIGAQHIGDQQIAERQIAERRDADADRLFHALADATRRDIAIATMGQEYSVSALARRYPMSFAAVQKHVVVLERAGLVTKSRSGREQLVRGNIDAVREAFTVLERLEAVWRARLDRFGDVLAELGDESPPPRSPAFRPTPTSPTQSPPTQSPPTHSPTPRTPRGVPT